MENKKWKRRNYFINPKLQLRYIGIMLSFVLLVSITLICIVYRSGTIQMIAEINRIYPEGIPGFMLKLIFQQLGATFLITLPVIILASVFLSHKIAGPLFRIKGDLKKIGEGDLGLRVRIRKGDELHDLVKEINDMTENTEKLFAKVKESTGKLSNAVKERVERSQTLMEHIHSDIEHIESEHLGQNKGCECVPALKKHVKDLDSHLHEILNRLHSVE